MAEELSKTERRRAAKAKKKAAAALEKQKRQDKREEMKQKRRDQKSNANNANNENGCWICGSNDHRKQDCTEAMSNKSCFHCRKKGHDINSCPQRSGGSDLCFNCGDAGHSLWKCPKPKVGDGTSFAQCFVCQGTGHLSSKCPLSEKGIYPKGGSCKVCQSKMHLAKDCPHKDGPQNTKKTFTDDDENDEILDGVPVSTQGGDELGDNDIVEDGDDEKVEKPKIQQPSLVGIAIADHPGQFFFYPNTYAQTGQWGSVVAIVQRGLGSKGAMSVLLSTQDGTARQSVHYVPIINKTLQWSDGQSDPLEVVIPFIPQQVPSNLEFYIYLHDPSSPSSIYAPQAMATISILALNKYPGDITFDKSNINLTIPSTWNAETPFPISIPVHRRNGAYGSIQVPYDSLRMTSGQASVPEMDFRFLKPYSFQRILSWADQDSTTKTIDILWINQGLYRSDMTFGLQLFAPTNEGALGDYPITSITVLSPRNVVPAGVIQLESPCFPSCAALSYSVQAGSAVRIYVHRHQGSIGAVSVNYYVDETQAQGRLSWPDGDASDREFVVAAPIGQTMLHVRLLTPTNGALLGSTAAISTVVIVQPHQPFLGGEVDFVTVTTTDMLLKTTTWLSDLELLPEVGYWDSGIGLSKPLYITQAGTLKILVRRSRGGAGEASVVLQTMDDTAFSSIDFEQIKTKLTWLDGEQSGISITLQILAPPYTSIDSIRSFSLLLSSPTNLQLGPFFRLPIVLQGNMQLPHLVSSSLDMSLKTLAMTFSHPVDASSAQISLINISNIQTKASISLRDSIISLPQVSAMNVLVQLGSNDFILIEQTPGIAIDISTTFLSLGQGFIRYDSLGCQSTRSHGCMQQAMPALTPTQVTQFTADTVRPTLLRFAWDQQYVRLRFSKVMDRMSFLMPQLCDSGTNLLNCVTLSSKSRLIPRGEITTPILLPADETLWTIWVDPADVVLVSRAAIGLTRATTYVVLSPNVRDIRGNLLTGSLVTQAAISDCTACPASTYLVRACTGSSDRICAQCTICGNGHYAASVCTPTRDTACRRCHQCHAGQYASQKCTPNQNRACSACTRCNNDQYEYSPCTTEDNRVCLTCDSCVLTNQQQNQCKTSVAFERRKRSPYGCPIVGTQYATEEARLQRAKSNLCGAGRCSCTGNGIGNANPNGFSFPEDPRFQLRVPMWRQISRNLSSRAEPRSWTPRKSTGAASSASPPKFSPQGQSAVKATPAARKTWDKDLKAWVPFVEKQNTNPISKQENPTGSGVRQPWLKSSALETKPRFRLFGNKGEVNVAAGSVEKRTPQEKRQVPEAKNKNFKFEKSLFSNDFFPDVSWNSNKDKSKNNSKFAKPAYKPREFPVHRDPNKKRRHLQRKKAAEPQKGLKVEIPNTITVEDLADRMCIKSHLLIRTLRQLGERNVIETTELTAEIAELAVEDMEMIPILVEGFVDLVPSQIPDDVSAFPARPPIVTVMGHVDHGKTTLLDALRNTTTKEHGGITQKIGSFTVPIDDSSIVFFDTPGHAAFSTMRAQGCSLTDILVVVIAADDGIRPQTKEVLSLATEHGLPLIVAITKCDRYPGQEDEIKERIAKELLEEGVAEEDMQLVCVSGKTGEGLDELKQSIILQSEIMDLRAPTDCNGEGVVVEGSIVRGWGVTVDMMVTWGTLRVGQLVVCGLEYGKIKSLIDENGKNLQFATPGTPVRMVGLKELPETGKPILPVESEEMAKTVVSERARIVELIKLKEAEQAMKPKEDYVPTGRRRKGKQLEIQRQERAKEEERIESLTPDDEGYVPKAVPIILKANALGIIDAIDHMIAEFNGISRECVLKRILAGVGPVTTSDIDLAVRTNATIYTFNTRQPSQIEKDALHKKVTIKSHNVIYSLMDDIETLITSQMTHVEKEEPLGAAEILQSIPINLRGRQKASIAGVRVTEGSLQLDALYRIVRDGETIQENLSLESMRHFQDKVSEMAKGKECGVQFDDTSASFRIGDTIEAYRMIKVRPRLIRE